MIKKIKIIIDIYALLFTTTLYSVDITICITNLKLLSKSHHIIAILDQKKYCYNPYYCTYHNNCVYLDSAYFFHPRIQTCISNMQQAKSLVPLLQLSQSLEKYLYIHNAQFVHELYLVYFIILKQITLNTCVAKPQVLKTIDLERILEISEKINQLPIAEILNAIDMLVTELPPFLEKYEFNSKISWKEWLKKYWWVPPIFGGWFALKILLSLQRPHYYFSPYLSPRPTVPLAPINTTDPVLNEIVVQTK